MMSLLIFYFTFLSIYKALPFEVDYLFEEVFTTSTSITPNESFEIFSSQCLLDHFDVTLAPTYVKVLASVVFLTTAYFLIVCVRFLSKENFVNTSTAKITFARKIYISLKSTYLIYFTENIIFLFNGLVPLLICVNVGDESNVNMRMVRNPNITCWEGQPY